MIHNIEEERKKQNRREAFLSEPFSDEELMRLISQVEEKALIHAPGGMKEEIFFQLGAQKRKRQKRQIFSYRAKVLVGMAAALAVLFLVPVNDSETANTLYSGIVGVLDRDEKARDEWEQEALDRQQDIDRKWERYCKGQERAYARKQYFEKIADKLTDYEKWED